VYRQRDSINGLLLLWILGVFAYATLINTTVNARTILMMVPAVGLLVARIPMNRFIWPGLALSFVIALVVTLADYRLAGGSRVVASEAQQLHVSSGRKIWSTGHWGFQWYMQPFATPVGSGSGAVQTGDLLIMNLKTSDPSRLPQAAVRELRRREISGVPGISMSGFYTDVHGPLPFRIGETERARFAIIEVTRPLQLTTRPSD
jgi:hypothetical protein